MNREPMPEWLIRHQMRHPFLGWSDVAGDPAPREAAQQLIWRLRNPEQGLPPRAALLSGPSGCGKTHLARAMCADLLDADEDWEVFELSAAELDAERCSELAARPSLAERRMIILDEVDLWAVHRDALSHTQQTRATLLAFLSLLDGLRPSGGLFWLLLSSRSPGELDAALVRPGRAGMVLRLPYPDLAARQDLFGYALRGVRLQDGADAERAAIFSGEQTTPAEIIRAAADALAAASSSSAEGVSWEILRSAIATVPAPVDEQTRLQAALHEAGHAVAAHRLGLDVRNVLLTAGHGVTELTPRAPGVLPTDAEAALRITVALSGVAAERLLGHSVLLGSADDHERASEWAISRLRSGLDPRLQAAALSRFERSPLASDAVHAAVSRQLRRGRRRAERLVRAERHAIGYFATALAAEQQLSGDLLRAALAPPPRPRRAWSWASLRGLAATR